MDKSQLFGALVKYHTGNLAKAYATHQGKINDSYREEVRRGKQEVHGFGLLVIADGDHALSDLINEGVICSFEAGFPMPVRDGDELSKRLREDREDPEQGNDGGYLHSRDSLTRFALADPHTANLNEIGDEGVYKRIPKDFVSPGGRVSPRGRLGTRTLAALSAPLAFPYLEGYAIRETGVYPEIPLGKLVHFGSHREHQGYLVEEFFFRPSKAKNVLYRNEDGLGVVGVYRRYEVDAKGELVKVYENSRITSLDNFDSYREMVTAPSIKTRISTSRNTSAMAAD